MANEYSSVPLAEIVSVTSGGTPSKANPAYWNGTIPWVSAKDMKRTRISDAEDHITSDGLQAASRLACEGSTLILTRGMTLLSAIPLCYVERPVAFNQDVKALKPTSKAEPSFIYYALTAARPALLGMVELAGHGTGRIPSDRLKSLLVPLPDRNTQRGIVSILGALDAKIELNRKMSATLEATARALFKSWFVDFDPVRAKAEGRDPGLPPEIAALFPDSFEDSELGEIPKGCVVRAVGDIADVVGGSTPKTSELSYWDGAYAWATPKDLANLHTPVLLSTQRTIALAGLSTISSGLLPVGTILLSSRAPIGYLAVADIPVAVNQGFIAMKPRAQISNLFLLRWAQHAYEAIVARANGSTFLEISKTNFRPIPVIVPPGAIMQTFDATAKSLYKRLVCAERESRTLAALRDALLPKLISGEIRVTDAERVVEKSA